MVLWINPCLLDWKTCIPSRISSKSLLDNTILRIKTSGWIASFSPCSNSHNVNPVLGSRNDPFCLYNYPSHDGSLSCDWNGTLDIHNGRKYGSCIINSSSTYYSYNHVWWSLCQFIHSSCLACLDPVHISNLLCKYRHLECPIQKSRIPLRLVPLIHGFHS